MDLFHKIDDGRCILLSGGVYKQADIYHRGGQVFAATSGGFVRLLPKFGTTGGTTKPKVSWLDVEGAGVRQDRNGVEFG